MKKRDTEKEYINALKHEYGRYYRFLNWIAPDEAQKKNTEKEELLKRLGEKTDFGCNDTKTDVRKMSTGCSMCTAGMWSCLFINGKCNANCFYCPSPQDEIGVPQSNGIYFPTPQSYASYLKNFGFKGMSLSGGEPFITFEKSLSYLIEAKKEIGQSLYTWLYTNGTLVDIDKLKRLRDSGLNEIRFDIGATAYKLDFVKKAIGIIPVVTVEIPAVPDKYEFMKEHIKRIKDIGVDYLNFHQLRVTSHNLTAFIEKNMTVSHGLRAVSPDSELMALNLLEYSKDNNIELPVNYCSSVYKYRYQHASARYRYSKYLKENYEDITSNSYIRKMKLIGDEKSVLSVRQQLMNDVPAWEWEYDEKQNCIFINLKTLINADVSNLNLSVVYYMTRIRQAENLIYEGKTVYLNAEDKLIIERKKAGNEFLIKGENVLIFADLLLRGRSRVGLDAVKLQEWQGLMDFEFIKQGLPDYF